MKTDRLLIERRLAGGAWLTALLLAMPASAWAVVAADDSASTPEEVAVVIDVLDNDADDGNPPLVVDGIAPGPANGSVMINGDNTVTYTPNPNFFGADSFDYRARDALGNLDVATVSVTVDPVNDAPSFVSGGNVSVNEDSGGYSEPWATGISTGPNEAQTVSFNVSNDNSALFAVQPAIDPAGQLTFTPADDTSGSATVTVSATDNGGTSNGGEDTSAEQTFTITIDPVNDAPSFVSGGDVSVNEDSGGYSEPWAMAISPGPNETQAVTFNVSNDDNALFAVQPAIDSTGQLTFTPAADGSGSATVTVSATDDGGNPNGGEDTSGNQTFTITVGSVNDAPSFAAGPDITVGEDSGAHTESGWATAISAGPDEASQSVSFDVSNDDNDLFSVQPAVDSSGNLTFTPALNMNGTATVTVRLTDNGGTANGGVDTSPADTLQISVTPQPDAPFVANALANVTWPEDGPDIVLDLSDVFDDPDFGMPGDSHVLDVTSNTNPGLFDSVDLTGTTLTLDLAFDANGTANLQITAEDGDGLTAMDAFTLTVTGVNDVPAPADDVASMDEDSGAILIDVLPNDYLAEEPTTVTAAGSDGDSQSAPVIVLDPNGDPFTNVNGTTANGAVTIVGDQIEYQPKEHFHGTDWFDYTITDADGDTGTARVTVTVNPVNDPPTGPEEQTYDMLENGILTVDVGEGLLFGSYDVEASSLTILPQTLPAVGVMEIDNTTGEFTYEPPVNFTGVVTLGYRLSDGSGQSADYQARIVITEAPEPPEPPPAGEVAATYNLTNVPLEQSTSVSPNVIIMMDDSGSMDWNTSVRGADEQGGFVLDGGRRSTTYYYLWDIDNNIFGPTSVNGRILPTEESLEDRNDTEDNEYGVWRARNHKHNRLYYNPQIQYTPWVGQDWNNDEYTNADPRNVRLDPRDPTDDIDLLDLHTYYADNVPDWERNDTDDFWVRDVYIPYYYHTPSEPPLEWDDPDAVKVEIRDDGSTYQGGPGREDCAAGDGNPLTCTYDQEIQNFANWFQYYRTREYAAKNGLGKVVSQLQDIRVGYETINDNRSEPVREMNDLHTEGNKKSLMDEIYRTNSSGSTPLRRALDRAGDIFAGDHGDDPLLPAPEGLCQQNFTLLFSDGYWNGGDPNQGNEDGDDSSSFDGGMYADDEDETLADVAMYFYERDIRTELDDLVPVSQRDRLGAPEGTWPDTGTPRMHQHMKTYTVAFGLVGTVDPADLPTDATEPFSWPDPEAITEGKLDDMLHAAVNGRGQFLSAVNPQELQTALESAFLEFTQAASSTSAAAFNSTSLQEGTLLYRGFYDLRDFTGELSATLVNPDGTLSLVPEWRASEQLNPANMTPDNRVLITYDPLARSGVAFRDGSLTADQQLVMNTDEVGYIRGQRGAEQPSGALRRRPTVNGLLGDIVNSSPVYVGEPRGLHRDQAPYPENDLYSEFVEDEEDRQGVVYVGSNDGILHGFDATSGEELFGYVPNKVIDGSQNYSNPLDEFTSPFYQHKYFVDLSPQVSDAYVRASATAVGRSWNSVLLGGLGAGGKGFFALNVSDPENDFSSENNARDVVLWEFTDEDDTSPSAATDPFGAPVKDLGYSLSLPSLAMSNVPDGDGNEWVAIFGNGPNSTAGVAKLFVLFMDRGLDGWGAGDFVKLDTGRGVPIAPEQLAGFPNGLGTPALIDTDLNGTVDWVYAGDRLGNLYRFDLCARDEDTEECSTDPDDWTVTRLFTATYDEGGLERLQPILTQPLVIKHPDREGFLVIFGTGSYITREDADSEEIQSIYAIWDRGEESPATAQDGSKSSRLVEQTLTNLVDDSVNPALTRRAVSSNGVEYVPDDVSTTGTYGWYVDLDMPRAANTVSGAANPDSSGREPPEAQFPGEKAIRRLLLRNGAIITTTVLPSLDEFSCYGTRPGAILVIDAVTGGDVGRPVIDFNNDGRIDEDDLLDSGGETFSAGLLFNQGDLDGALVDLSTLGGEGNTDWLFACGGNDCLPFRLEPPDPGGTGRLSWRELTNN